MSARGGATRRGPRGQRLERGRGGPPPTFVGVVSDTHGLLREGVLDALAGAEAILHAGDVGDAGILERLATVAPVHAVRGNTDGGALARRLPAYDVVEVGGLRVHLLHILEDSDLDPEAAEVDVVVFGHTHEPGVRREGSVLYLNPGSAGPRRFRLPVTVARLRRGPEGPEAEIVELEER